MNPGIARGNFVIDLSIDPDCLIVFSHRLIGLGGHEKGISIVRFCKTGDFVDRAADPAGTQLPWRSYGANDMRFNEVYLAANGYRFPWPHYSDATWLPDTPETRSAKSSGFVAWRSASS